MRFLISRIRPRRRARGERGAVLIIGAFACIFAIVACALGVDIGRIAVDKKNDQKVADLAALDAARAVGFILNTTNDAGYKAAAQAAAAASSARNAFPNGVGSRTVVASVGKLDPATMVFTEGAGNTSAVQVKTTSYLKNEFMSGGQTLGATAVAFVGSPEAAFSVGSTLASLDTSKSRLDPMLQSMLGSGSLSLVSYSGLAGANVSLGRLQTALISGGVNVGTMDQLLNTDIKVSDLLTATASALTAQGSTAAAAEINDIPIASIPAVKTVKLGQLVNVSQPSDSAALAGVINVYQLLMGSAEVANGANFVTVPLVGVNLLGLAGVSVAAKVISPAQTGVGPVGTTAENAQIAMRVGVDVNLGSVLLPNLAHVSLTYTTAEAKGTLTSIVCGVSPSIGVSAQAAGVTVAGTATVLVGTLNIAASALSTALTSLSFAYPSEFAPATKHVGVAGSGVNLASVSVTGTNLATNLLAPVLQLLLPGVLSTLDTALNPLIRPLFAALGLDLSSVDVAALGIYPDPTSCGGHPRLAK